MPRGGGGSGGGVLTCPWRAPTGPAAGWGPPSGPGRLWWAAPADPPSASRSSPRSPSRSPPSSVEPKQSMLGVCLYLLITLCTVCVCVLPGCFPSGRTLREGFQTPAGGFMSSSLRSPATQNMISSWTDQEIISLIVSSELHVSAATRPDSQQEDDAWDAGSTLH